MVYSNISTSLSTLLVHNTDPFRIGDTHLTTTPLPEIIMGETEHFPEINVPNSNKIYLFISAWEYFIVILQNMIYTTLGIKKSLTKINK